MKKLKDLSPGTVFNIENTPSYPKLKLEDGYVDMRDEIVNKSGNCDDREVFIMEAKDIVQKFMDDGEEAINVWIDELKKKYLSSN